MDHIYVKKSGDVTKPKQSTPKNMPPCQRSDRILMKVSQNAYDMIHYMTGLYGYLYVCEIYVNLKWYLYLFMLNKFCLSLSLRLSLSLSLWDILYHMRRKMS